MGHGVHSRFRSDVIRHGHGEIRVQNSDIRLEDLVDHRDLQLLVRIGDHGGAGDLRGGAGGGGDRHQLEFADLGEGDFADDIQIQLREFIEEHHGFGRIHTGTPAHRHHGVRLELPHQCHALVDLLAGGILPEPPE